MKAKRAIAKPKKRTKRRPPKAKRARRQYAAFHRQGVESERRTTRPARIPAVVWALGDLVEVVYKRPDGYEYKHSFRRPFAKLCYSPKTRRLYIVGGGYVVQARGIVN